MWAQQPGGKQPQQVRRQRSRQQRRAAAREQRQWTAAGCATAQRRARLLRLLGCIYVRLEHRWPDGEGVLAVHGPPVDRAGRALRRLVAQLRQGRVGSDGGEACSEPPPAGLRVVLLQQECVVACATPSRQGAGSGHARRRRPAAWRRRRTWPQMLQAEGCQLGSRRRRWCSSILAYLAAGLGLWAAAREWREARQAGRLWAGRWRCCPTIGRRDVALARHRGRAGASRGTPSGGAPPGVPAVFIGA